MHEIDATCVQLDVFAAQGTLTCGKQTFLRKNKMLEAVLMIRRVWYSEHEWLMLDTGSG